MNGVTSIALSCPSERLLCDVIRYQMSKWASVTSVAPSCCILLKATETFDCVPLTSDIMKIMFRLNLRDFDHKTMRDLSPRRQNHGPVPVDVSRVCTIRLI